MSMGILNLNCIQGSKEHLSDNSVDLMICDPPFGIGETKFHKHYNRKENTISGYQEAPDNYYDFTSQWMAEAKRVMKPNASMYVISGWSNLCDILRSVADLDLFVRNHIIWKFNFGVNTNVKWITSHYHILYVTKSRLGNPTFNRYCRFGPQQKDDEGGSRLYQDMEDVWYIKKEYQPNQKKNKNKLPEGLLNKIIRYSSNELDVVCDFFLGNFTTAIVAKKLNRRPIGFEINPEAYKYHMPRLQKIEAGCEIHCTPKVVVEIPKNQGKTLDNKTRDKIRSEFKELVNSGQTKKSAVKELGEKYQRGSFSITNIVKGVPIKQRKRLNGDKYRIFVDAQTLKSQGQRQIDIYKTLSTKYGRTVHGIEHLLRSCEGLSCKKNAKIKKEKRNDLF